MARSRITLRSIRAKVADGLVAFGSGQQLICMDDRDIDDGLDRQIPVKVVLERKVRRAAETGRRGAGPRPHIGIHAIDIVQPPSMPERRGDDGQ
jgi:hypothetical protein